MPEPELPTPELPKPELPMPELPVFGPLPDARPHDQPWPAMTWPPPAHTRLAGSVVSLTPLGAADTAPLFAALDDDRVWAHLAGRQASADAYALRLEAMRAAGFHPWVLRLATPLAGLPAGTVVGTSSYLEVSPTDARLEIGGTAYSPAVWGTAVNPEAKLLLLTFAFEQLGVGRVQLKTDVRNVRSQQAIARLGARYEGVLARYQRRADGSVRDTVVFAITAEDWPAVRARLAERLGR